MRAWTYDRRGPPQDVLKLQHDIPPPRLTDQKPNEAVIQVSHVSLFAPSMNLMAVLPYLSSAPRIPEQMFAGKVIAIATGTSTELAVGDEVFGMINPKKGGGYGGVLAEQAIVPIDAVVRRPENISAKEASGLGGNGATVIDFAKRAGLIQVHVTNDEPSLVNKGAGKRILITGGNTATGQVMVQFARYIVGDSGIVVATASSRSERLVLHLGADKVVDYTSLVSLHKYLMDKYSSPTMMFDTIIDIAGSDPQLYPKSPAYLRKHGWFIFGGNMSKTHMKPDASVFDAILWIISLIGLVLTWVVHMFRPVIAGGIPRNCAFVSGTPSQQNLRLVQRLVEMGVFRTIVDSEWKMDDALQAYEHLAKGQVSGKVVINVQA